MAVLAITTQHRPRTLPYLTNKGVGRSCGGHSVDIIRTTRGQQSDNCLSDHAYTARFANFEAY
jgi:hypothetical protein